MTAPRPILRLAMQAFDCAMVARVGRLPMQRQLALCRAAIEARRAGVYDIELVSAIDQFILGCAEDQIAAGHALHDAVQYLSRRLDPTPPQTFDWQERADLR